MDRRHPRGILATIHGRKPVPAYGHGLIGLRLAGKFLLRNIKKARFLKPGL